MSEQQTPQEYFRLVLLTVVGQAYGAAGYVLEDKPLQWSRGQFRFVKLRADGLLAFIDYQLLSYAENMWVSGKPSRFRVTLTRTDQPTPTAPSSHVRFARRDLSVLVVEDFGVGILPSADHWWTFENTTELGHGLAEAGHLVVGYGMPWLAGELIPPERNP